jgi:ketosteroid isomerase-like protein
MEENMKKLYMILPLSLILCFMLGCQDKEAMAELEKFKAQAEVEEQNKALVIRSFKEMDKQNFDFLNEIYADDFVGHFPPYPDFTREALIKSGEESYAEMPDYTHTIEDIIAEGDKVVVSLINKGTDKKYGKVIEFPVILIHKFVDGKVVEIWGMIDFLGQAQQRGMELKPKEGE